VAGVIALDATVLIAYLDDTDPHHRAAAATLGDHAGSPFATSALTMAETLVRPVGRGAADRVLDILVTQLEIITVPVMGTEAARLAEIRAHTGLKMPDCCVLLAAERVSASKLATFDTRLGQVAAERGLAVLPGVA
jgi:predicted nucleic acid-binding protein